MHLLQMNNNTRHKNPNGKASYPNRAKKLNIFQMKIKTNCLVECHVLKQRPID